MIEHDDGGAMPPDRPARAADADIPDEVAALRDRIEAVDRAIVERIAERVRLAEAIGRAKREAGLPTLDPGREAAVIRRATAMARDEGMEAEDVRDVFWHIVGLCRRAQLGEEP